MQNQLFSLEYSPSALGKWSGEEPWRDEKSTFFSSFQLHFLSYTLNNQYLKTISNKFHRFSVMCF